MSMAIAPEPRPAEMPPVPADALLREIFVRTLSPMLITDTRGCICHANAAFEQTTGYCIDELRGQRPSLMRSELQSDEFYRRMWSELERNKAWQGEIWNRRKDGRVFREWLSISSLRGDDGAEVTHYLGVYSGLASAQLSLAHGAEVGGVDAATGVLSRRAFMAAAERMRSRTRHLAVICLDICGFTDLNEHYGLACGDALLRQLALQCTQTAVAISSRCAVGRVGADEFAIALAPANEQDEPVFHDYAQAAASTLHHAVSRAYEIEPGRTVSLSVSIGVAPLACDSGSAAEALLHASAARQSPNLKTGTIRHYTSHDSQRRLVHALREDILGDRIEVAFQPKVDISNGRLMGLEALARWHGPDSDGVPPSVFIPLAERNGLIADLGERVFERVLKHLNQWRADGLPLVPVAVNFSAAQFHRSDIAIRISNAFKRHGLETSLVELELTESVLLGDFESVVSTLNELRGIGLGLSIDDFGTGYSSLAYLRHFPVNSLKIDRSFVADIVTDDRTRQIVGAIISLTHQFEMVCVAEGVETIEQWNTLREMGCDQVQGYLVACPLAPQALPAILAAAIFPAPDCDLSIQI